MNDFNQTTNLSPLISPVILEVQNLKKYYPVKKWGEELQWVKAVDDVSLTLKKGETLGLVGESGSGKSTLAKMLLQIEAPTSGKIIVNNQSLEFLSKKELCQQIQMVFQDPYSSLNPRKKAWQIIAEPLMIHMKYSTDEYRQKAIEVMKRVGLASYQADRYPHMFSGGQRQRINLARALIMHPQILCLDEPVSALDVSIQAQVINLLLDLQEEFELSYFFISHDLSVVRFICDYVLVMHLGKIVEEGPTEEIFTNPKHPYTQTLLASSPVLHFKST